MNDEQVNKKDNGQAQAPAGEDKSSRNAFPRISLKKVLVLPKMIFELGEGDPVPRLVVFDKMGRSAGSGLSRMLITTSNAYGLSTGGYQAERLGITDLGKAIVSSDDGVLTQDVMRVLFSNSLFEKFYEKYKGKSVPSEPIAIDALKQLGGINDKDAKAAFDVFLENLSEYGFIQEFSGKPSIVTQDMLTISDSLTTSTPDDTEAQLTANPANGKGDSANPQAQGSNLVQSASQQLMPQFNFNIQIQLPEDATPEQYDAIFKSMAEHLLTLREG